MTADKADDALCVRCGKPRDRHNSGVGCTIFTLPDEPRRRAAAAVPETLEGLRRQNSAYRALCASLEAQMAILTEKGRQYQEAVTTLDSEREANAIMTDELTALRERVALLEGALAAIANDPYQHGQRVQKMKAIARAALSAAIGEDLRGRSPSA